MKYKISFLIIAGATTFFISGCDAGNDLGVNERERGGLLKVAGQYPEKHINTKSLVSFTEEVKEKTNKTIDFKVYPANSLGDYTLVYEEVMKGTIDMALITLPIKYSDAFESLYINYLAEDYSDAREVYGEGSSLFNIVSESNDDVGVKFLGFHAEGFAGISTVKEIPSPLKLNEKKDLLLRIPPMNTIKRSTEAMGFGTVNVDYSELYSSLQTGVVDGAIGLPPNTAWHSFKDVIDNYYKYNNFFEVTALIINEALWDSFEESQKNILSNAAQRISQDSFDLVEEQDREYTKKLKESGVNVVEFSEEDIKEIVRHNRENVWPQLDDVVGDKTINRIIEAYE